MLSSWKLTPLRMQLLFTLQHKNKTFSQAQTKKAILSPKYIDALDSIRTSEEWLHVPCHGQCLMCQASSSTSLLIPTSSLTEISSQTRETSFSELLSNRVLSSFQRTCFDRRLLKNPHTMLNCIGKKKKKKTHGNCNSGTQNCYVHGIVQIVWQLGNNLTDLS